ncbi:EamA family transporter [Sorangium sp. So ce1335]|uniref:EamA family transporter n=1 Tax=Sorangium sp. So ce1335 TaxID=3133335 RepID=UPI003F602CF1
MSGAAAVQPARGFHRSLRATLFMTAGAALLTWSQVALRFLSEAQPGAGDVPLVMLVNLWTNVAIFAVVALLLSRSSRRVPAGALAARRLALGAYALFDLLGITLFLAGSLFLPLATNSLLYSLHVVFTPFLLWVALREAPGAGRGLIAIWAFVGVAIYFHEGLLTYDALHGVRWLALLLPLTAAVFMSLVNLSAHRLQGIPFEHILFFTSVVGIAGSVLGLVTTGAGSMIFDGGIWSSWDQLVFAAGAGAAAQLCIVLGLTSGSLIAAVITESLTVVLTGIAGLLFLREPISLAQSVGMGIILSAIVLINLSNRSPGDGAAR